MPARLTIGKPPERRVTCYLRRWGGEYEDLVLMGDVDLEKVKWASQLKGCWQVVFQAALAVVDPREVPLDDPTVYVGDQLRESLAEGAGLDREAWPGVVNLGGWNPEQYDLNGDRLTVISNADPELFWVSYIDEGDDHETEIVSLAALEQVWSNIACEAKVT